MTSPADPRRGDEITVAWLDQILGPGVADIDCSPIGTGQVGSNIRVMITAAPGANHLPPSVIVKLPSPEPESRAAADAMNTYRREVGYYLHLHGLNAAPQPECHYASIDDDGGFILVLSDIDDGEAGDQLAPCSTARITAMIDTAAALHAPTWDRVDDIAHHDWLGRSDAATIALHAGVAAAVIDGFVDRYENRLDSHTLDTARWLATRYGDLPRDHGCAPCLVHGDLRLDNMLFRTNGNGEEAVVVDYQTVAIGSGPADVAYLIATSLTPDQRRDIEESLWHRYIDRLHHHGIHVTAASLHEARRIGTVSALMMAIIASQIVTRTTRGDEMFAVMAERAAAHMADHHIGPDNED